MFERFTDGARRVVVLAQEEARLLNHDYIGTEHLLLGLTREGDGVAARALEASGLSLGVVRQRVEEIVGRGQPSAAGHIPFTSAAKTVLELSVGLARSRGHSCIGTDHLLLAVIGVSDGVDAPVLGTFSVELHRAGQAVIRFISTEPGPGTLPRRTGDHEEPLSGDLSGVSAWFAGRDPIPDVAAIRSALNQMSPVAAAVFNQRLAQLVVEAAGEASATGTRLRSLIGFIVDTQSQESAPARDVGGEHD
jgi:ATP-dependent Clp protease ATP-binding subunit ClpA